LKTFFKISLVYALLAFPMFYFVYKYGTPDLGMKDFYDYYKLYSNWDLEHVDAPFNMRLLSTFFVYVMNQSGLHYNTTVAFAQTGLDQQVFFNAVLFNYLCITATCSVLFYLFKKQGQSTLLSFSGGALYLLGFGTLFFEFMPITDAFSVLFFTIILYLYLTKNYLIILPLLLMIIQREYIFMALGLLALLDYWKLREKFHLHILLGCVLCFAIYFILRKTIFFTPKYDHQASFSFFLSSLFKLKFSLGPYIRQTIMTLNLFILYFLIMAYKKYKKLNIGSFDALKLFLLFVQINLISFAAVFGNNTGRYFYILVPLVIFYLVKEAKPLLKLNEQA
jgi:hypothetical protein